MTPLSPVTSFLRRFGYGDRLDPSRDWMALLALSAMAFICLIIWNVWAFGVIANGGVIGTAATSTPPAFDHQSIDAVNAIFVNRAAEEERYDMGVYRFADPSQ